MLDRFSKLVTTHYVSVVVLMLLLTAGAAAGIPQLDMEDQTGIDDEVFNKTEVGQALVYSNSNYDSSNDSTATSSVSLRPEDGNALSREQLVATLAYQEEVLENSTVESELVDENAIQGPPTLIGQYLAGENASIAEQRTAIENASDEELDRAIKTTLATPPVPARYLPQSYEPGSTEAESMRIQFTFERASVTQQQETLPDEDAQRMLYETAEDDEAIFTMGTISAEKWETAQLNDVFWLIIPPALVLVIAVLVFAYRDLVDVVLGFTGVILSVIWFFGILGWLGVPAGFASIVGPVLIVALSIDFGLHVFMRYREERDSDEGIKPPMRRSTSALTVTFLLVAITAAVGFLANVTSPIGFIRAFGVVITLGVLSAVLLFVTFVPALKIWVEEVLERYGVDRRKPALGTTGYLENVLSIGVTIAQRGAVVMILLSVLAGAIGMVAIADIDRQGFQEDFVDEDDWQTEVPDPFGWSAHEMDYRQNLDYIEEHYQSDDPRESSTILLIRGDVTDPTALERFLQSSTVPTTVAFNVYGCQVEIDGDGNVTATEDA